MRWLCRRSWHRTLLTLKFPLGIGHPESRQWSGKGCPAQGGRLFCQGDGSMTYRYRFISEHHASYGVTRLCRVLAVPRRQGYYEWLAAQPARRQRAEAEDQLAEQIRGIHADHRGAYGSPRVAAELRRRGRPVNRKRVERVMRERGIVGHTRRRRRSLTRPDAGAAPAPDLIGRDFTAPAPGHRFVGDITYLPTEQGWLYLATTIDLFNREVVGHAMADHMRAELACDAIELAHRRGLVEPQA